MVKPEATDDNIVRRMRFEYWVRLQARAHTPDPTHMHTHTHGHSGARAHKSIMLFYGNCHFVKAPQCYAFIACLVNFCLSLKSVHNCSYALPTCGQV